jgi:CrcB protein
MDMNSSFCCDKLNFLRNLIAPMEAKDMPRCILDDAACLEEMRGIEEARSLSNTETDLMRCPESSDGQQFARNDNMSPAHKDKPIMGLIYSAVAISALSVAGVASRITLLNAATNANFLPQATSISVNLIGSFIMGLLVAVSGLNSACPYMHNALTVGFCGSFTTFSSWTYSIIHGGNALVELGIGFSAPFAAFALGCDVGGNATINVSGHTLALDKVMVCAAAICAVSTLVLLSVFYPTRPTYSITDADIIACALAPIGALTRWILCKNLNNRPVASPQKNKTFRLGTLASNVIAAVITGALDKYGRGSQLTWCVLTGVCGSLSTVSSWVADTVSIYAVSKKWGYIYCGASVCTCVLILVPFSW